jgi:hypothetical protein
VEFTEKGEIIITVTSTLEGTHCQHCGKEIKKFYSFDREISLRHLSILDKPTAIHIIVNSISRYNTLNSPGI